MMYETPELQTERLILKNVNLTDLQKVYEYDFTKLRIINGEFKFVKFDPKKIEGWVIPEPETYDWIIYIKETMEPIGNITADREDKSINGIELAFNTHPSYWRKGYTSEALIEVMRYLFNNGYENVLCGYDEGNLKSKNIGEKLGFLPYKVEEKNWIKDGIPINTYMAILNKQRFMDDLYDLRKHSK